MAKQILECSSSEYFSRPEVSNSMMKTFRGQGSWTYYHKYITKTVDDSKQSDSLRLGSAFHSYMECAGRCLNTDEHLQEWLTILPEYIDDEPLNLRLKAHREFVEEYKQLADDRDIPWVTPAEFQNITGMVDSALENPVASDLILRANDTTCEVKAVNTINGVDVKGMAALYLPEINTIVDYKTTRQHSLKGFIKDAIYKYKYHLQAAHYCDVFECDKFIFIAVRSFEPFETIVYEVHPRLIQQGKTANHSTLDEIKFCTEMDEWHTDGWMETNSLEEIKHG